MLFTSLLVIANDNDKPECIFSNIQDSVKKKVLTYENNTNLSSNYMLLTRKVIGVNGNIYSIIMTKEPSDNVTKILCHNSLE